LAVLVEGARIADVGPRTKFNERADAERIELTDATLFPA